jgi:protein-S-isoprenylcysteine O-methyltransferase Ste14
MTDKPDAQNGVDAPDVLTFPPVIFAIFFVIGYVTDLAFPVETGFAELRLTGGAFMIILSIALVGWALSRFISAKTHVDVRKSATTLVTDGPYRLSRNPMYLAASLIYGGVAIILNMPWTLVLLIPCLITLYRGVIRREETYLEGKFGQPYRDYKNRVRRWL